MPAFFRMEVNFPFPSGNDWSGRLSEKDVSVFHDVVGDGLGGPAHGLDTERVGFPLTHEDTAFLECRCIAENAAVITVLVKPGDGFCHVGISASFLQGFPVEAFQQFGLRAVGVPDAVQGGQDDAFGVAGDDGGFLQFQRFPMHAHGYVRACFLTLAPVAQAGAEDFRDGTVALEGEVSELHHDVVQPDHSASLLFYV